MFFRYAPLVLLTFTFFLQYVDGWNMIAAYTQTILTRGILSLISLRKLAICQHFQKHFPFRNRILTIPISNFYNESNQANKLSFLAYMKKSSHFNRV